MLDEIWRKYVIPSFAENVNGGFLSSNKAFKKMQTNYDKLLRKEFSTNLNGALLPEQKLKFINIIFESMGPIRPCEFIYKKNMGIKL